VAYPEHWRDIVIDYHKLSTWHSDQITHAYTARDTILYAMGVGIGLDPMDDAQRRFIYEKDLVALPSMCAVLASPGSWMRDRPEFGIDFQRLVHGEQTVEIHAPLPTAGTVRGVTRVSQVVDKGDGKGAVVYVEKILTDAASDQRIATVRQGLFCRGDGGFSKQHRQSDAPPPPLPAVPEGAPEKVLELSTCANTAALYRLSGDFNPLHIDPSVATKVGFVRPILHGLATYGVACHGLVKLYCGYEPSRLRAMSTRFAAPVYPGETIRLECWRVGDEVTLRARCVERDIVVLSHGRMR
jgi:acyl dehydratase